MSNLREFYKVDELKAEIAELKKQLSAIKAIKGNGEKKLELPVRQAYESMKNREFLSKEENQK